MKLKTQMRERIRVQGKSKETFKTYWKYCEDFIRWIAKRDGQWVHPQQLGVADVEQWLTFLANKRHVSKTTQNVALQSLCYLYRHVLRQPLEGVNAFRAKRPHTVRDVLDVSEVTRLFEKLDGVGLLVAQMIYGCGLRIGDVVNLRVKDVSFERKQLHIHSGKGDKSRFTSFPQVLHDRVRQQIAEARRYWEIDQKQGNAGVSLFGAYHRKNPSAAKQFGYYYVFCSGNLSRDDFGVMKRHHRHKSHLSRQISQAAREARIHKKVGSHVLRHSYATHANEQGVSMRRLQVLLGHTDIRTTETYVHANQHKATASKSPLESLLANPDLAIKARERQATKTNVRIWKAS